MRMMRTPMIVGAKRNNVLLAIRAALRQRRDVMRLEVDRTPCRQETNFATELAGAFSARENTRAHSTRPNSDQPRSLPNRNRLR